MVEEESREQIEEIINNPELTPAEDEIEQEEVKQEEEEKPKPKSKAKSKAKPKIKITKESVQPIEEEPVVEVEPEQPKQIDKSRQMVKCPDCDLEMTQHTLKYIHKRRGFCKAKKAEPEKTPEPEPQKPKITEDIVNDYIKQNPETVF